MIALVSGCAPGPQEGSPVYYQPSPEHRQRSALTAAEDALLLARIKAKIFSDELVDQGRVTIKVRHGVAILEGKAQDVYHRRLLMDLIRTVDGVVGVKNQTDLIHKGTTFVTAAAIVRDNIQMALLQDPDTAPCPIQVAVTRQEVILTGSTRSQPIKQKAAAVAKKFAGDRRILNHLSVADN